MKKNITLLLLSIFLISGCAHRGEPRPAHTANEGEDYKIRFLFEVDGVKVYRFYDGSGLVYFTNANGITRTERTVTTEEYTETEPVVTYCNRKP